MEEATIYEVNLPPRIRAVTILDEDCAATTYVNSRLTRERNLVSWSHEADHIEHDDFHSPIPADTIECIRHWG